MQLSGQHFIAARRQHVWRAIMDPDLLQRSIPRCTSMIKPADDTFRATLTPKLGPVRTRFEGQVTMLDVVEHVSYRLVGGGSSRLSGAVDGTVIIRLQDQQAGTVMQYELQAILHGKLARMGARLLDKTASRLTSEFFDDFAMAIVRASEAYSSSGVISST